MVFRCLRRLRAKCVRRFQPSAEYLPRRHSEKLRLPELFRAGPNLRFAGKGVFLKSHGFDHLYGTEG